MESNEPATGFSEKRLARIISVLIVLGGLAFVFFKVTSLTAEANATVLYNPLLMPMEVQLDGNTYQLMPGQSKSISIKPGTFRAVAKAGGKELTNTAIQIMAKDKMEGCLINLSGEPLYLWTENYGGSMNSVMANLIPKGPNSKGLADSLRLQEAEKIMKKVKAIRIDSVTIIGNIKEYPATQYVITREWFFGPDQAFEKSISGTNKESLMGKEVAKIFSKKGVLQYWKETYENIFDGVLFESK